MDPLRSGGFFTTAAPPRRLARRAPPPASPRYTRPKEEVQLLADLAAPPPARPDPAAPPPDRRAAAAAAFDDFVRGAPLASAVLGAARDAWQAGALRPGQGDAPPPPPPQGTDAPRHRDHQALPYPRAHHPAAPSPPLHQQADHDPHRHGHDHDHAHYRPHNTHHSQQYQQYQQYRQYQRYHAPAPPLPPPPPPQAPPQPQVPLPPCPPPQLRSSYCPPYPVQAHPRHDEHEQFRRHQEFRQHPQVRQHQHGQLPYVHPHVHPPDPHDAPPPPPAPPKSEPEDLSRLDRAVGGPDPFRRDDPWRAPAHAPPLVATPSPARPHPTPRPPRVWRASAPARTQPQPLRFPPGAAPPLAPPAPPAAGDRPVDPAHGRPPFNDPAPAAPPAPATSLSHAATPPPAPAPAPAPVWHAPARAEAASAAAAAVVPRAQRRSYPPTVPEAARVPAKEAEDAAVAAAAVTARPAGKLRVATAGADVAVRAGAAVGADCSPSRAARTSARLGGKSAAHVRELNATSETIAAHRSSPVSLPACEPVVTVPSVSSQSTISEPAGAPAPERADGRAEEFTRAPNASHASRHHAPVAAAPPRTKDRAKGGKARIGSGIRKMSEAMRLQQSVATARWSNSLQVDALRRRPVALSARMVREEGPAGGPRGTPVRKAGAVARARGFVDARRTPTLAARPRKQGRISKLKRGAIHPARAAPGADAVENVAAAATAAPPASLNKRRRRRAAILLDDRTVGEFGREVASVRARPPTPAAAVLPNRQESSRSGEKRKQMTPTRLHPPTAPPGEDGGDPFSPKELRALLAASGVDEAGGRVVGE